jgi:ketosteroid isomerase-like protein
MLRTPQLFVSGLLVSTLRVGTAIASDQTPQGAVRGRRQQLTSALNRHDLDQVRKFYASDFRGHDKDGTDRGTEEMMDTFSRAFEPSKQFHLSVTVQKIEVKGPSVLVTSAISTHFVSRDGTKRDKQARMLEVWKKLGGNWVIAKYREL